MECHTWFYKRVEIPSKTKMIEYISEIMNKNIEFYNRLINKRDSFDEELLKLYPEWTVNYAIEKLKLLEEEKYLISKNNENLIKSYCEYSNHLYVNGNLYKNVKDFHNEFIDDSYPQICLFSLEDTIKYINNNNCITYIDTNKRLIEFWEKYPNGMIKFK